MAGLALAHLLDREGLLAAEPRPLSAIVADLPRYHMIRQRFELYEESVLV